MIARLGAVVAVVLSAASAQAAEPLVDAAWLKAHLGKPGVVVLDVRAPAEYLQGHIPGSVSTDYARSGWRVDRDSDKAAEQLPADLSPLARHIGALGIGDDTQVVLIHGGRSAGEVGNATRIYWTFKYLGHDEVSILDGGMVEYLKDKSAAVETGPADTATAHSFTPRPRPELLVSEEQVVAGGATLVDARTEEFWLGLSKSPVVKSSGTIAGSHDLPFTWVLDNGGGRFRTRAQLEALAVYARVPARADTVVFCNTGHLASIDWFALHEVLGNAKARLYAGSLTEWTAHGRPVEQKIKLP